jgi:hypothetical protein
MLILIFVSFEPSSRRVRPRARHILVLLFFVAQRKSDVLADRDVSASSVPLLPDGVDPRTNVGSGVLVYDVSIHLLFTINLQKLRQTVSSSFGSGLCLASFFTTLVLL